MRPFFFIQVEESHREDMLELQVPFGSIMLIKMEQSPIQESGKAYPSRSSRSYNNDAL